MAIRVEFGAVKVYLTEAGRKLGDAKVRALRTAGAQLAREMIEAAPHRSGALRSSIWWQMPSDDVLEVGVVRPAKQGGPLVYAAIQEFGGTVHGRPWLAIPLNYRGNPVLTSAGVTKTRARDLRRNPGALGFIATFVAKGVIFGVKPGGAVSIRSSSRRGYSPTPKLKGGGIVPLYVLKSSVTIKPKRYIFGTWERMQDSITAFLAKTIAEAVDAR